MAISLELACRLTTALKIMGDEAPDINFGGEQSADPELVLEERERRIMYGRVKHDYGNRPCPLDGHDWHPEVRVSIGVLSTALALQHFPARNGEPLGPWFDKGQFSKQVRELDPPVPEGRAWSTFVAGDCVEQQRNSKGRIVFVSLRMRAAERFIAPAIRPAY